MLRWLNMANEFRCTVYFTNFFTGFELYLVCFPLTDLGETVTREEFLSLAALLDWPPVDVTRQTLARDFALFIGEHADTISM